MGNLLSPAHRKSKNIYEPFVNPHANTHAPAPAHANAYAYAYNIDLAERIQELTDKNRQLEEEIKIIKKELELKTSRIDTSIQIKYNELTNMITYHNEKTTNKINVITNDMENLLNNDKILLDKLIEKNIVSTIQEESVDLDALTT
jgi:hypothetical protein